ncbi:hypothetical protein C8Q80DRAFT_1167024 [Daedaleopsis nitida]|nr:hypothetical protein C8Q80DRAFT_1167024 [Daedaleopsis nitida]
MSLPPPTTVSTRSLRPRKSKGKTPSSSQRGSGSGSSRSDSLPLFESPQHNQNADTEHVYGSVVRGRNTKTAMKREHSVSPVAGPSTTKKRRSGASGKYPTSAIAMDQDTRSHELEGAEPVTITTTEPLHFRISVDHDYRRLMDDMCSSSSGGRHVATDAVPNNSETQGAVMYRTPLVDDSLAPLAGTSTHPPETLTVLSGPEGGSSDYPPPTDVIVQSQAAS